MMLDNNATTRNAGDVVRYHTRKVIHRQDVANHTWNVMRLYVAFWGSPRAEVYLYMLFHDAQEVVTGDVPFQIKRRFPDLKKHLAVAETYANKVLDLPELPELTPVEKYRVKYVDLWEMKEYAETELRFGNLNITDVIENINQALVELKVANAEYI